MPVGYPDFTPDLCVEILPLGKSRESMLPKIDEYLGTNVRMVWVLDLKNRTVTVLRLGRERHVLSESDTLSGEDVLPGFSVLVSELFPK